MATDSSTIRDNVQSYYGNVLESSRDLKTNACATVDTPDATLRSALRNIHPEISNTYYGCGLVYPEALEGARVLDLGSGSGRDCYVLSQLVGESGEVVGVDMTPEQLDIARRHNDYHAEKFGYLKSNVSFHHGYLESLDQLPLEPGSFDVIVSNCVINLCTDKAAVFRHAQHLLKPGGEMYFADVYADRRIDTALHNDPVLYGECLGGALYWNDFVTLAKSAGFHDPRLVTDNPIAVSDTMLNAKVGHINFYSATYRLFNLTNLEPACEDYGQAVIYRGTLPSKPESYILDKHHTLERGRAFPVCGNTWRMLHDTRLAPHFEFIGDWSTHYGIFEGCGTALPFDEQNVAITSGGCC